MNEVEFRQELEKRGYGEAEIKTFEPGPAKDMHTHDESVMVLILEGQFTLVTENQATTYGPGDCCENPAGTLHTEEIGPQGVKALMALK